MNRRDDDIEFDFFEDEPETGQAQAGSGGPQGSGGGRSRRLTGPPRGAGPILRLAGLVGAVIVVLLVFAWIIDSFGSSKKDAYANYMSAVNKIAQQSTANGADVVKALDTPGIKSPALVAKLSDIAAAEQQNVKDAQSLNPPGRLQNEHLNLIEALQLRVSGIDGLATTFRKDGTSTKAPALLAMQANRLLASDVVWADLFNAPAKALLVRQGITGVNVPSSQDVTDSDFTTVSSMGLVVTRISGAATGGKCSGIHGTNIVSVKAQPSGQTLTPGPTGSNAVTSSNSLSFQVTVEDSGQGEEVGIPVQLSINTTPKPIEMTQTINSINPGEQTVVTFYGFGGPTLFESLKKLTVDVKKVPCELNGTNNTATYNVLFRVPG